MNDLTKQIQMYVPKCEQEEKDKETMLSFLIFNDNVLLRENKIAHFTASSWIVNPKRDKVLMIYHNIFDSWAWTGGHADGEEDLLAVAIREAKEETGIETIEPISNKPFSLEILTVDGHQKRGEYVPSHLHLNLTFLMVADESQRLEIKADENSGVKWIPITKIRSFVSEFWMMEHIYEKLISR